MHRKPQTILFAAALAGLFGGLPGSHGALARYQQRIGHSRERSAPGSSLRVRNSSSHAVFAAMGRMRQATQDGCALERARAL